MDQVLRGRVRADAGVNDPADHGYQVRDVLSAVTGAAPCAFGGAHALYVPNCAFHPTHAWGRGPTGVGRTMLRLLGVRGALHVTLMVGHLCPGWSERVFGASARPDGPAGPALPGSARLGVPRPFRRGHMLVMAGGAPEPSGRPGAPDDGVRGRGIAVV